VLAVVATAVVLAITAVACTAPQPQKGPKLEMDPSLAGGFFSMPWPNDVRKTSTGALDLEGLPGVELLPGEASTPLRSMFPAIIDEIAESTDSFGVNTATYFRASAALNTDDLPSPSASTAASSPVLLMDLDHLGTRAPVIVDLQRAADRNRPSNTLAVLPYPGHPLEPSTRYAVAVTTGIRGTNGKALAPASLIGRLDQPWSAATGVDQLTWDDLRAQRDEVRGVLEDTTSWAADDLAAFTVFTTQEVGRDLQAVAATIDANPAPTVDVTGQAPCGPDGNAGGQSTANLIGTVALHHWQEGTYPYLDLGSGGEIVVDGSGSAVPQGDFAAEFTARVPCGEPPANGWPLLTFIDGTGGTFDIGSSSLPLSYQGYLIVSISPTYGAGRGVPLTPLMEQLGMSPSQFAFYNFFNPDSIRANTIQQTGENLELIKAWEHVSLPGGPFGASGAVTIDPDTVVISGQSQGAQTLSMVSAARPGLAAVVSSVGSGGLYHTISHNAGNRRLLGQFSGDAAALDELNPIVQVAQTFLEGGDGVNFPSNTHQLSYAGHDDTCSTFENTRYFAGATSLGLWYQSAPTSVYGDPALDPPTVALPAQGNAAGLTRVALELDGGHYVAYDHLNVTDAFLADVASGTTPVVPDDGFAPGWMSSLNCPGVRWDVPPTRFGR
jgi:hypothetical protein